MSSLRSPCSAYRARPTQTPEWKGGISPYTLSPWTPPPQTAGRGLARSASGAGATTGATGRAAASSGAAFLARTATRSETVLLAEPRRGVVHGSSPICGAHNNNSSTSPPTKLVRQQVDYQEMMLALDDPCFASILHGDGGSGEDTPPGDSEAERLAEAVDQVHQKALNRWAYKAKLEELAATRLERQKWPHRLKSNSWTREDISVSTRHRLREEASEMRPTFLTPAEREAILVERVLRRADKERSSRRVVIEQHGTKYVTKEVTPVELSANDDT